MGKIEFKKEKMRNETIIAIVSISAIFALAFFIFNIEQSNLTNFIIYNDSSSNSNESINTEIIVTREDALQAINDSEEIIQELKDNNISVIYVNDLLIEIKKIFERADYAEILRGNINVSEADRQSAIKALASIDWKKINYSDILNYTIQIKERKENAFYIYDELSVIKMNLEKYEKRGINMSQSKELMEKAKTAFYEDRYSEAESLIKQTRDSIDLTVSEFSVLRDLRRNTINFFQKNWYYILAVLSVLAIFAYLSYKQVELNLLKDKIKKMKAEKIALNSLMKKAQIERFKENKISGLTYNLRIKKYEEKLSEIEEELPVFEERLKRFKTKKKLVK